eukprot:11188618-Lingulodinium_polyedra.AAC.1
MGEGTAREARRPGPTPPPRQGDRGDPTVHQPMLRLGESNTGARGGLVGIHRVVGQESSLQRPVRGPAADGVNR